MRAAIFDLDGTLADTSGDLLAAANAALAEAGVAGTLVVGRDEGTALRGGRPMLRLGLERAGRPADEALVDALYPRLLEHYGAAMAHHTRLYEGAATALEALTAAGWRLGVCTNKPHRLAERLLAELGIADFFHAVIGADALPVRKPDPRHLTETILRAGGQAAHAVMVGDTVTDRDAARAAGVPCILVGFGPSGGDIRDLHPAGILLHYDQLLGLLDALLPLTPAAAEAAQRAEAAAETGAARSGPRLP